MTANSRERIKDDKEKGEELETMSSADRPFTHKPAAGSGPEMAKSALKGLRASVLACRGGPGCVAMGAGDGEGDAASLRGHTSPTADGAWRLPSSSASGGRPQNPHSISGADDSWDGVHGAATGVSWTCPHTLCPWDGFARGWVQCSHY